MQRREFMTLMAGAAASLAAPCAARAQQPDRLRLIGVMLTGRENDAATQARIAALREGLAAHGWIEGRNYRFEFRYPAGDIERSRRDAAELVALAPDAVVVGGITSAVALKQQTSAIPIVFANIADPVGNGLVSSLKGSGNNITGFTAFEFRTASKWLELLTEIAPTVKRVAFVYGGPDFGTTGEGFHREIAPAAAARSIELVPIRLDSRMSAAELEAAIAKVAANPDTGLIAAAEGGVFVNRATIIAQAARLRLPAVYPFKFYADEGGLASYGPDLNDLWLRVGGYVDRVLKGARPGDLPVQAPDRFELVFNLKTANALGIVIPAILLARADKVIE